ncbi:unnamed protein product [Schistosoma bovis]|nr:unnamed protein product [Schistosoma bovis]
MQQIILTTQLKDLSMFSNVTHIGYCMKLKRGETEMDGSGILNCELMNLVKKRVACRDRIVELHDKYTQDKLNKMKSNQSLITANHEQRCDTSCLPLLDISPSVVRIKDIVEDEELLVRQFKALNGFECHNDRLSP